MATLTSIKLDKNVTLRFFFKRIVEEVAPAAGVDDVADADDEIAEIAELSQLFVWDNAELLLNK